eukprot:2291832-Amphidinium_carterae.1
MRQSAREAVHHSLTLKARGVLDLEPKKQKTNQQSPTQLVIRSSKLTYKSNTARLKTSLKTATVSGSLVELRPRASYNARSYNLKAMATKVETNKISPAFCCQN